MHAQIITTERHEQDEEAQHNAQRPGNVLSNRSAAEYGSRVHRMPAGKRITCCRSNGITIGYDTHIPDPWPIGANRHLQHTIDQPVAAPGLCRFPRLTVCIIHITTDPEIICLSFCQSTYRLAQVVPVIDCNRLTGTFIAQS